MTDINYNEATHSIVYTQDGASVCAAGPDPMFHWDVRFPERLSRLHLSSDLAWPHHHAATCLSPLGHRQQRRVRADRGRYRTQPITFDEIAEVDEDGAGQGQAASAAAGDDGPSAAAGSTAAAGVTAGEAAGKDGKVSCGLSGCGQLVRLRIGPIGRYRRYKRTKSMASLKLAACVSL